MRKQKPDVQLYVELVNQIFGTNLLLTTENGTNTIKSGIGNEPIFTGTITECYYFVLGMR